MDQARNKAKFATPVTKKALVESNSKDQSEYSSSEEDVTTFRSHGTQAGVLRKAASRPTQGPQQVESSSEDSNDSEDDTSSSSEDEDNMDVGMRTGAAGDSTGADGGILSLVDDENTLMMPPEEPGEEDDEEEFDGGEDEDEGADADNVDAMTQESEMEIVTLVASGNATNSSDREPIYQKDIPKSSGPALPTVKSDNSLTLASIKSASSSGNNQKTANSSQKVEAIATSNPSSANLAEASTLSETKKKRKKRNYTICLVNCKYDCIRRVAKKFGFREVEEDDDWMLYWTDYSVTVERVCNMKRYQKVNHFPAMSELCRKDCLARNLTRMLKCFPKDYNIFPRSWCLPADYADLQAFSRSKKHKTYILKPDAGCQGRGIWITKKPSEIKPTENMVCQVYMSKPFLIDGFKFDMRLYVLVAACDPLRIFVFKDGLVRFTTQRYTEPNANNVENVYMHLTNYAVQKNSSNFIRDNEEGGTKRRITTIERWFVENGYDLKKIWADVDEIVIKTIISAHSVLKHNYRTCFPNHNRGSACFEILGFDIIFDRKLKPHVLEVNHSPSFTTDSRLDREIKDALIWDTMNLINFGVVDRKKIIEEDRRKIRERLFQKGGRKETKEEQDREAAEFMKIQERYEQTHLGNYRRIYPLPGTEKYDKFFVQSVSLYQETAAFKARSECARQQREDIRQKQEKLDSILNRNKGKGDRDRNEVRPESPNERRQSKAGENQGRRLHRSSLPRPSLYAQSNNARTRLYKRGPQSQQLGGGNTFGNFPREWNTGELTGEWVNSSMPQPIVDEEEVERLSGLLQRDSLIRGLGVAELVHRLLQGNVAPSGGGAVGAAGGLKTLQAPPYHFSQGNTMSSVVYDPSGAPVNHYALAQDPTQGTLDLYPSGGALRAGPTSAYTSHLGNARTVLLGRGGYTPNNRRGPTVLVGGAGANPRSNDQVLHMKKNPGGGLRYMGPAGSSSAPNEMQGVPAGPSQPEAATGATSSQVPQQQQRPPGSMINAAMSSGGSGKLNAFRNGNVAVLPPTQQIRLATGRGGNSGLLTSASGSQLFAQINSPSILPSSISVPGLSVVSGPAPLLIKQQVDGQGQQLAPPPGVLYRQMSREKIGGRV